MFIFCWLSNIKECYRSLSKPWGRIAFAYHVRSFLVTTFTSVSRAVIFAFNICLLSGDWYVRLLSMSTIAGTGKILGKKIHPFSLASENVKYTKDTILLVCPETKMVKMPMSTGHIHLHTRCKRWVTYSAFHGSGRDASLKIGSGINWKGCFLNSRLSAHIKCAEGRWGSGVTHRTVTQSIDLNTLAGVHRNGPVTTCFVTRPGCYWFWNVSGDVKCTSLHTLPEWINRWWVAKCPNCRDMRAFNQECSQEGK